MIRVHPLAFALILVTALIVGGFVANLLPWGDKRMTYAHGTAYVLDEGSASFMPGDGSAMLLPSGIAWADRNGNA